MEQRLYDPALSEVKIALGGEQTVPSDQPPFLEHFTLLEFLRVGHKHLTDKLRVVDRVSPPWTQAEGVDVAFRSQRLDEIERMETELKGVPEEGVPARHSRNTDAGSGRSRRLWN
jgi:hypothetical protein